MVGWYLSMSTRECVLLRTCCACGMGWGSTSPPHTRPFDVKAVESLKHCRRPWLLCTNHPLLIKNAKKVGTRQHLMVAVLVCTRFMLASMAPWESQCLRQQGSHSVAYAQLPGHEYNWPKRWKQFPVPHMCTYICSTQYYMHKVSGASWE